MHARDDVFAYQLDVVHDIFLGCFRIKEADRDLVETQVPVPSDLLYAFVRTAHYEGIVHQGF